MVGGGGITENMGIPATLEGGTIRTDTLHEPKAMPGRDTVIRHVLGAPFRFIGSYQRSAQGPVVHLPLWP